MIAPHESENLQMLKSQGEVVPFLGTDQYYAHLRTSNRSAAVSVVSRVYMLTKPKVIWGRKNYRSGRKNNRLTLPLIGPQRV